MSPNPKVWGGGGGGERHNDRHGGHFGIPIEDILAVFDLQYAPVLLTKFRAN